MRLGILAPAVAAAIMASSTLLALPAKAATINWTLVDIKVDDGSVVSGTFSTDSITGFLIETDFNISTGDGLLPAAVYDPTTSHRIFQGTRSFVLIFNDFSRYLTLLFDTPLTSPGFNPIEPGDDSRECDNCTLNRYMVSGGAVGVFAETPLPGALPLFTTGLGMMGLLVWRRKQKALAARG